MSSNVLDNSRVFLLITFASRHLHNSNVFNAVLCALAVFTGPHSTSLSCPPAAHA